MNGEHSEARVGKASICPRMTVDKVNMGSHFCHRSKFLVADFANGWQTFFNWSWWCISFIWPPSSGKDTYSKLCSVCIKRRQHHKAWTVLQNYNSFTRSKTVKQNLTQRKTCKLQEFWHWSKLRKRIFLENNCSSTYQIRLLFKVIHRNLTYMLYKSSPEKAWFCQIWVFSQPANIFTRIYPSYPWHFATLGLEERTKSTLVH